MPLARLENLLKNLNGNILYVDPAQLDSTDSIQNRGNSALRPFKTIQRALLEAVRFSYVQGANNDLFDQTTILISPGNHYIDNRPGFYVDGNTIKNYSGSTASIPELNLQSTFDINDPTNELYKYNSADGGVIIPRGVSIVASDLRKTKIRPKYVPSPTDPLVGASSIFKLTGSCYIFGFSIFDGDPNGNVYSSPSSVFQTPPNYSHHKLTAFEYVDGKNKYVKNGVKLDKTDLEMYYYKVSKGFGTNSGIPVIIDWGVNSPPDLYPNNEENRIVGDLGFGSVLIDDLYAGDGVDQVSNIVTVTTKTDHNLSPNTSILISNVGSTTEQRAEYNGAFTVAQVISSTEFTYRLSESPQSTLAPTINNDSLITTVSDTVSSSSPYVFNCSLKSVYGMNGLHADGSKATGFKSIVTAQFTGISLQKDDNAFVIYNEDSGTYNDQSAFSDEFLHQNSRAICKPDWESFHIKASNDAFIQCVSIFAIGYSKHFVADNGGDQSITNSNSNFGAISLCARGFKDYQLEKDNHAFITHIIPPKEISQIESQIRCLTIDSTKTGVGNTTRVYLKDYNSILNIPSSEFRGFTVGGRENDKLYINYLGQEISATISPNYKIDVEISNIDVGTDTITLSESFAVGQPTGINTSQAVRIVSNDGILPDGLDHHKIYYIHKSLTTNTIKLSPNESSSTSDESGSIVNIKSSVGITAGNLRLVSKVSDRISGQAASPIQFDSINGWYINIEGNSSFVSAASSASDPTFYLKRIVDTRTLDDKLYRARLVLPKDSPNASEPSTGFIIQRSSSPVVSNYTTSSALSSVSESRNTNQIVDAWTVLGTPNTVNIATKNPHNLKVGNIVNIYNLKSSNEPNPVGLGTGTGYNGTYIVTSIPNELQFTYQTSVNPGTITTYGTSATTWPSVRNCSGVAYRVAPYTVDDDSLVRQNLPYFTCESLNSEYQLYKINTIQNYSPGVSDGVYYVTLNAFKNIPNVSPFNVNNLRLSQSLENLYPSIDPDNSVSDPYPTKTVASRKIIGKVDLNDLEYSVTKETTSELFKDLGIGQEISSISKSGSTCTITTTKNHGLGGIRSFSISGGSVGSGFVNGVWHDILVCGGTGSNATAIVTVSSGAITSVRISYHGSGYTQGSTVTLRGIPHTSTSGASVNVTISSIVSTSKLIQIIGSKYNQNDGFYPITSVTSNTITYENANGSSESGSGVVILSGESSSISSLSYNSNTNSTSVTLSSPHSISVGNKICFSDIPSQTFDVISTSSSTTFVVSGNASVPQSTSAYVVELSPSFRDSNTLNENLSTRQYPLIAQISTRTSSSISESSGAFTVVSSSPFNKSDFIQVDDEIMMITSISGSGLFVLRGLFNTKRTTHSSNKLVKKITPISVELRRNSILRASGHTFEYTGFGPGNYSTGMPTNQNRVLTSDEVLISQSLSSRGGSVLYTGMNSDGEFYIGRKKFNALTGEEQLLGIPTAESELNYSDDLTVNNLTVVNELDATTADSKLGPTEISSLTVNNDATITGNLEVDGNVTGDVTGNLTGNVTGNLTGNVTGNVTGNLTGNVTGNLTGNVTGNLTGNVTGNATTATTAGNGAKVWGVVSGGGSIANGGSGGWTVAKYEVNNDNDFQGRYLVTFNPTLPTSSYCIIAVVSDNTNDENNEFLTIKSITASSFKVITRQGNGRTNVRWSFVIFY